MTTYATDTYYQLARNHQGAQHVTLVRIDFTNPTARSIYLCDRPPGPNAELETPDGRTWEHVIQSANPIEAPGEVLSEGPNLATWSFTLKRRKLAYQASGSATVLDAFKEYEWQGATLVAWSWYIGCKTFAEDGSGDNLEIFRGSIDAPAGDPYGAAVACKQTATWKDDLPNVKITRERFPGAPDPVIDASLFAPDVIGLRQAQPFPPNYPSPYGSKLLHEKAGGVSLLSQGVVVDTGRSSGKLRVLFAGHSVDAFNDSAQGCDLFIRGGQVPSVIVPGAGYTLTNDANGAIVTVDLDTLRAFAPVLMNDVRASQTTCLNPTNALDVLATDTFALLNENVSQGALEFVLPNVGTLGVREAVTVIVAYATTSSQLVALYRNHYNGATGTPRSLPSTFNLDTIAIAEVPWDGATNDGSWDFGGDGNTFLKDLRIGFATPSAANVARVYWAALCVKYRPSLNVIVPAVIGQAQGPQFDIQGRPPSGREAGRLFSRQPFIPSVTGSAELLADFFCNLRGLRDESDGRYTGTANAAVSLAPDAGQLMLARFGGVALSSIERGAGVFGSFVDARTKGLTYDGETPRVGGALKSGNVKEHLQALARETRSTWFVNQFTGRHSWVQWDTAPTAANYPRKLTRDDLLQDRFTWRRGIEANTRNRVKVSYGLDDALGRHRWSTELAASRSTGGHDQRGARDQALTIVTGVNDKLDWVEEYQANAFYGAVSGSNSVQLASSSGVPVGTTIIDRSRVAFPSPVTVTGTIDGTHVSVSATASANITFGNAYVTLARYRSATLAANSYLPSALAAEARTKMKAQSSAAEFKVDWGFEVVTGYNDQLPVLFTLVQYLITLDPGFYTGPSLAAHIKAKLLAAIPSGAWTVTYGTDRKFRIACSSSFTLEWVRNAGVILASCANLLGYTFNTNTGTLSSKLADYARRGEAFIFARANANFGILPVTGPNAATSAWGTFGYRTTLDAIGATAFVGDFRRGVRENLAAASELVHGPQDPIDVSAEWLYRAEDATDLRDGLFDWQVEQRIRVAFASFGFPDLERFMIVETDASLDGLLPYPRAGSDGSWANRLWMVYKTRRMMGGPGGAQGYHREFEAVELGKIGAFAPVSAPPAVSAAVSLAAAWGDSRAGGVVQNYVGGLVGGGNPAFTLNGQLLGTSTTTSEAFDDRSICPDGSGGFYIAFAEGRGGGNPSIFITRITSAGALAGGWPSSGINVRSGQSATAGQPVVITDENGGCVVVWRDDRTGGDSAVYAQRFSGSGVQQWAADGVRLKTGGAFVGYYGIKAVPDGSGGACVIAHGTSNNIFCQRIAGTGAIAYGAAGVSLGTGAAQGGSTLQPQHSSAAVVADGFGGAFYCYGDQATLKALDSNGATLAPWAAGGTALASTSFVREIVGVSDGQSGAIFAWVLGAFTPNYPVQAQAVSTGAVLWTAGGVNLTTAGATQTLNLNACRDGVGGIALAWEVGNDVRIQRANGSGGALWGTLGTLLAGTGSREDHEPYIVRDGIGGFYIVWTNYPAAGPTVADIFAQHVDTDGSNMWAAEGIPIGQAANRQQKARAASASL